MEGQNSLLKIRTRNAEGMCKEVPASVQVSDQSKVPPLSAGDTEMT